MSNEVQSAQNSTILELKNISQSYDGGKTYIIKDLNLKVLDKPDQGQFVIILGASGSEKSTVLRYIAGMQVPTLGDVLVKNQPVARGRHINGLSRIFFTGQKLLQYHLNKTLLSSKTNKSLSKIASQE